MLPSLQMLVSRDRVHPLEPLIGSIACVVAPTLVRLALASALGSSLPFATYFPTALLATLLWGARWGAGVLVASGTIAVLMFMPAPDLASPGPKLFAALTLFLGAGTLVLLTGSTLRHALRELQTARVADSLRKRELQHRLKNTLAIVQSFSAYLSRTATDKAEFQRLLAGRIVALAAASESLFAEKFEACALPETAEAALAPFADDQRLTFHGAPVRLQPESCEPLALALHELATNAHKYGALSADTGQVTLSWQVGRDDPSKCIISWLEAGGPPVQPPAHHGLGRYLLQRQRGLDAVTIDYLPTGLTCELVVPVLRP